MHQRKHFAVLFIILSNLTLFYCTAENRGGSFVAGSSDYDDRVGLFNEFREFQQPTVNDGVPDFSVATMEYCNANAPHGELS